MQFEKHKHACEILKTIDKNPANYLIIHYSCESFYDIADGHTPRITSIAVYHYASAQTESFSIHKTAEKLHIQGNDITNHYDELEKKMLSEYFAYVKEHQNFSWIHWNMRDINYGFKAIEHRYEVLGGKPIIIQDEHKVDLSRVLIEKYGVNYIENPRLSSLLEYNKIKAKDFLVGADEAKAFEDREYIKLHQSTLRKVDVFANILNRSVQNTLKVKSKWTDIYGLSPQGIFEYCKEKWWIQILISLLSMVLGAIIGRLF